MHCAKSVWSQAPVNCFPGYIFNFASTASKKLSESVAETAQNLKKSVEDGKLNGIIDKVGLYCMVLSLEFVLPSFDLKTMNKIFVLPSPLRPYWGISRRSNRGLWRRKKQNNLVIHE